MVQRPPVELLPGKITDHTDKAHVGFTVTGHFKAYLLEALHKEAYTISIGEYCRDIIARHIAEQLEISPMQVLANSAPERRRGPKPRYQAG